MEILAVVSLIVGILYFFALFLTWSPGKIGNQILRTCLSVSLLVINILIGRMLLSSLWGALTLFNLYVLFVFLKSKKNNLKRRKQKEKP